MDLEQLDRFKTRLLRTFVVLAEIERHLALRTIVAHRNHLGMEGGGG